MGRTGFGLADYIPASLAVRVESSSLGVSPVVSSRWAGDWPNARLGAGGRVRSPPLA